ncbi:MAG: hypothetical protein G01um101470_267 [Parcubacteria group bacterium Gr01-1014_70]|nr:MAG: hypothetical protein G01um101470_267 [Parcubacteria group bacterium Gr01-1014_70]
MNGKQTVIIFSTAYMPFIGGAELAVKDITDRVEGLNFILLTARMRRDLPRQERIGSVEVYRVGLGTVFLDKLLSPFLASIRVRRLARQHSICLFWSVMASYTSITPALLHMFGLYRNIPLLVTLQEGDSEAHIARARLGLVGLGWQFLLRHAAHVQVISTYLAGLARTYGYTGDITIVPNGVDISRFQISDFRFQRKEKIIITVSRLVKKNGVDMLIQAFAEVYKRYPEAKLYIVGDGELRSDLEGLSRRLGIALAVTFFGSVPHERVPEYQKNADIFVRASRSEGLGTSFLEAMAMGIPVIGTRVGGIPDFLLHEKTGLFAHVDDSVDLSRQILRLFEDRVLYDTLSRNGRTLVENAYSWDSIAKRMETIFRNICVS